jgi:hypothetical protein
MHFGGRPSLFFVAAVLLLSTAILSQPTIHPSASGSSYQSYIPITITNHQSVATASPFQDSFSFNPSLYISYEVSDLGNIRFYETRMGSSFSNELHGWMESYSGSTTPNNATSATVWIQLPSGIGAQSSVTVYMVFESTTVDFDGVYWGEAPQLSPRYGQFDDGAYVFSVYNNGTNLFSSTQTGTGGTGPTITSSAPSPYTHAITGSVSGGSSQANTWTSNGETTSALPASYIAQMYVYLSGTAPLTDMLTNVQTISSGQFYVFRFDARGGSHDLIGDYPSGGTSANILSQASAGSSVSTWYQMTAIDNGDQLSLYKSTSFSLGSFGTLEGGPVTGVGYNGGGIAVTTDGATSQEYWTMIIVRAYPPNGVMSSFSLGSVQIAVPAFPFDYSFITPSATLRAPSVTFGSTISPPYVPITLANVQSSPTTKGLQVLINIDFRSYESHLVSDAGNIRFFNSSSQSVSSELPAWLEYYSGNNTNSANTATTSGIWLDLKGTVINSNSFITIYMVFENGLDFDGLYFGEAPQLSSVYGEFDNGASVFAYYNVAPSSVSGWSTSGLVGQTSSSPTGSHFGSTDAYYANSGRSDYMYTTVPNFGTDEILTFWTYTTGLGNAFFLANSGGKGQMVRLDSRGGSDWSGLASTSSWTSWAAPSSGLDESARTWYKYDVVMNGSTATAYIGAVANDLSILGTKANSMTVTNDGNILGLVGDALGSSYVTYWNGIIVRYFPPNGIFPTASFGSVVVTGVATTISPERDAASVGVTAGLPYYESATAAASCSTPSMDTSYSTPTGSVASSFSISAGTSVCLWSPQYTSSSTLYAGSWLLTMWAVSVGSSGSLSVSIYTTNSSGSIGSNIVSNAPSNTIGTTLGEVQTAMSGAEGSVSANGYIELVMTASSSGPSSFTVYWGSSTEPTNLQSPTVFSNILVINNTSSSPMQTSISLASSVGATRIGNFTILTNPPVTTQVSIGSMISTQVTTGTTVTIAANSVVYVSLDCSATSPGQSIVTLSLKSQAFAGGSYSQYTIVITVD